MMIMHNGCKNLGQKSSDLSSLCIKVTVGINDWFSDLIE